MKSNIMFFVIGVLLILMGFASLSDASQVPKVQAPSQIQVQSGMVRQVKPVPNAGTTSGIEGKFEALPPQLKAKGFMSVIVSHLDFIENQFAAAYPNDYDGDGIPNDIDVVCPNSPKQVVMLTKADMPTPNDYIYTVDTDQNLSSDVTVGHFLLRYIIAGNDQVVLRSYYNPNQVDSSASGYNCVWPPSGDPYRDVTVTQEFTKLNTLCGNHLVRWIYRDPATDNVILQFINLTQIPGVCRHPNPGPYTSPEIWQPIMQEIMDRPECQNLEYPTDRFSQIAYEQAAIKGYPIGCKITYPIETYTGPTHGPCYPTKSCREVSGNCASAGMEGDCSDLDSCCTLPIVK